MLRVHQARPPCLSGKSAAGYPGRPGKNHGMGIRSARRCRAGGGQAEQGRTHSLRKKWTEITTQEQPVCQYGKVWGMW